MSPTLIAAIVILVLASFAFIAVGAAYRWDLTATGYGRWTRAIGALAVVALTLVAAWTRRADGLAALAIAAGGAALAAAFWVAHSRLTARLRSSLSSGPPT